MADQDAAIQPPPGFTLDTSYKPASGVTPPPGFALDTTFKPQAPAQSQAQADINSVAQGLVGGAGGAVAGVGRVATAGNVQYTDRMITAMKRVDSGDITGAMKPLTMIERAELGDYIHAAPDARASIYSKLAQTQGDLASRPENAVTQAGEAMQHFAGEQFPVSPENEGIQTGIGRAIGGAIPGGLAAAAGTAIAGPVGGALAAAATVGTQAFDSTYKDAIDKGATPTDAESAAGKSAAMQALIMALPVGHIMVPLPLREGLGKTLMNLGQNGVEFGSANAVGTFANNYVAQQTYDPNRPLTQGTGQAGLEGAIAGLIVPSVATGMARTRAAAADIMKAPDVDTAISEAQKAALTTNAPALDLLNPALSPVTQTAPNSLGAAASREGTPAAQIAMSPEEAAANRSQGEIERFAAPPARSDTTIYVPGTKPTLAEVSGDPKAAMDQAYNRQQPEALQSHIERENQNAEAVADYYADTAGSAQTLMRMERERDERAQQNIQSVFGDPQSTRAPADPTNVIKSMDDIINDPRMQERDIIQKIIPNLIDRFYNEDGSMKTDPLSLYGIRQHIGDLLDGAGDPETNAASRMLRRELMQIQSQLDDIIEAAAPGFAQYRADYANDSRAIDAMKLLQDERLSLLNKDQRITPAKWFTFMKGIIEGRTDPMDPASSLSDEQMDRLWNITDQLKRQTLIDSGTPRGSWTSMMQEWGGKFARATAHVAALHFLPVVGNAGVEMGSAMLRSRNVNREMNRVLNPDLGQPALSPP